MNIKCQSTKWVFKIRTTNRCLWTGFVSADCFEFHSRSERRKGHKSCALPALSNKKKGTRPMHRKTDANLYPERQLTKASEPSFDLEGGAKGQTDIRRFPDHNILQVGFTLQTSRINLRIACKQKKDNVFAQQTKRPKKDIKASAKVLRKCSAFSLILLWQPKSA